MKITHLISAFMLLCIHFSATAQEEATKPLPGVSVHDFYLHTGSHLEQHNYATLNDFQALASQSQLLQNDLSGFSSLIDYYGISGNTMVSALLGLQFSNKEKTSLKANPLLRLGITYFSSNTISGGLSKHQSQPYDTLTSSQTGQTIYLDSVQNEYYNMNYSYEQVRIEGSLIFRTNPQARLSIYGGVGLSAGLSVNARTDIYHSTDASVQQSNNGNYYSYYSYYGTGNYETESIRNKTNLGVSAFIPLGIDLRLGKKREFWKRLHLFYEMKPGINITSIPELHTIANTNLQQGFGLRVSWE